MTWSMQDRVLSTFSCRRCRFSVCLWTGMMEFSSCIRRLSNEDRMETFEGENDISTGRKQTSAHMTDLKKLCSFLPYCSLLVYLLCIYFAFLSPSNNLNRVCEYYRLRTKNQQGDEVTNMYLYLYIVKVLCLQVIK